MGTKWGASFAPFPPSPKAKLRGVVAGDATADFVVDRHLLHKRYIVGHGGLGSHLSAVFISAIGGPSATLTSLNIPKQVNALVPGPLEALAVRMDSV